jgi:hypothetical protein
MFHVQIFHGQIDKITSLITLIVYRCRYGGGLRFSGDFDPVNTTSTGKGKIVHLTLPPAAMAVVAGTTQNSTFKHFTALKTVGGAGVTTIGERAFSGCTALASASFPQATTIGEYAFSSCALTSVSFPQTTAIGSGAFFHCTALTSVSFPLPTTISFAAFYGCTALASVSFPQATTIGGSAFLGCTTLTSVSFPQARTIDNSAFKGCTALASVSFPQATTIGYYVFESCAALASVTLGATPPTLGVSILGGIPGRTVTVRIPNTSAAKVSYGVANLPGTNFDNSNNANSWGRAFKGTGRDLSRSDWASNNYYVQSNYPDGTCVLNNNITLRFETY